MGSQESNCGRYLLFPHCPLSLVSIRRIEMIDWDDRLYFIALDDVDNGSMTYLITTMADFFVDQARYSHRNDLALLCRIY